VSVTTPRLQACVSLQTYLKAWEEPQPQSVGDRWRAWLPACPVRAWLPELTRETVVRDCVAGLSTGINLVVKSLAFASLAGVPPEMGLYSATLPALVYALLGSSPHLGVGPSPLVCLLTGALSQDFCASLPALPSDAVAYLGNCTADDYVRVVRQLALAQGTMLLLAGLVRGSWFLRFFSRPMFSGFLTATALIISCSQLKYCLYTHEVTVTDSLSVFAVLRDLLKPANLESVRTSPAPHVARAHRSRRR